MTKETKEVKDQEKSKDFDGDYFNKPVRGNYTQYDIDALKATVAKGLQVKEFALFLNTCISTGLNPFLKQIIPTAYESKKNGRQFNIQVPVEGIEHLARQKSGWQGCHLQLVYEHDKFKAATDEFGRFKIVEHSIEFPRGQLLGGYCVAMREDFDDVIVFMEIQEVQHLIDTYPTSEMWKKWTNDMFKKHIKKRALREQYGIEIDDMENLNAGIEIYKENEEPAKRSNRSEITQEEPEHDEAAERKRLKKEIKEFREAEGITKEEVQAIAEGNYKMPLNDLSAQRLAGVLQLIKLQAKTQKKNDQEALKKQFKEQTTQEEEKGQETPLNEADRDALEEKFTEGFKKDFIENEFKEAFDEAEKKDRQETLEDLEDLFNYERG